MNAMSALSGGARASNVRHQASYVTKATESNPERATTPNDDSNRVLHLLIRVLGSSTSRLRHHRLDQDLTLIRVWEWIRRVGGFRELSSGPGHRRGECYCNLFTQALLKFHHPAGESGRMPYGRLESRSGNRVYMPWSRCQLCRDISDT